MIKPDRRRLGIEAMRELARRHEGECLSEEYRNAYQKLNWRCARGHVWSSALVNVMLGRWCPTCSREKRESERLERLRSTAIERGVQCLSEKYKGNQHKHAWACGRGHAWSATPPTVLRGCWCPECYWLSLCLHDQAVQKYLPKSGAMQDARS
jgi:hypothetical protein